MYSILVFFLIATQVYSSLSIPSITQVNVDGEGEEISLVDHTLDHCKDSKGERDPMKCHQMLIDTLLRVEDHNFRSHKRVLNMFKLYGEKYMNTVEGHHVDSLNWTTSELERNKNNYLLSETMDMYSYYGRSPSVLSNTQLILRISHYQEQLGWVNNIHIPFVLGSKTVRDSRIMHVPINQGNEVSCYLLYIIHHYDSLPEYTLFLHGHNKDWHQLYEVAYITRTIDFTTPYKNVNNYLVNDRDVTANRYMRQLQALWSKLFQDELGDMPMVFREKCCAQFVVHRDRIHIRSLAFYQRIYDYVISAELDDADMVDGYHTSMSYVMEFIWHYIFGEDAVLHYPDEAYVQLTENIIVYL